MWLPFWERFGTKSQPKIDPEKELPPNGDFHDSARSESGNVILFALLERNWRGPSGQNVNIYVIKLMIPMKIIRFMVVP